MNSSRLLLFGCFLFFLLSFSLNSCSKDDDTSDNIEIIDSSQEDEIKDNNKTSEKKPIISSIKITHKNNGTKVSSSVSVTVTVQTKAPEDAPVTKVTISCDNKSITAKRSHLNTYTASLNVPGKAYGVKYIITVIAYNDYGSYKLTSSFTR